MVRLFLTSSSRFNLGLAIKEVVSSLIQKKHVFPQSIGNAENTSPWLIVSGVTWHLVHWVGSITYNSSHLLFTALFRLSHVLYFVCNLSRRLWLCVRNSVSTFTCHVLSSAGQVCNVRQLNVLIRREKQRIVRNSMLRVTYFAYYLTSRCCW